MVSVGSVGERCCGGGDFVSSWFIRENEEGGKGRSIGGTGGTGGVWRSGCMDVVVVWWRRQQRAVN